MSTSSVKGVDLMRKLLPTLVGCLLSWGSLTPVHGQNERVQVRETEWKTYSLPNTNFNRQISPEKDFLFRVPVDWKQHGSELTFDGPHSAKIKIIHEKVADGFPLQEYVGAVMRAVRDTPGSSEAILVRRTQMQDLEAREIVLELPEADGEIVRTVMWIAVRGPLAMSFVLAVPVNQAAAVEPYFKAMIQSIMFIQNREYLGFETIRTATIKTSAPAPLNEVDSIVAVLNEPNSTRQAAVARLASLLATNPDQAIDLLLDRRPFVRCAAVEALALSKNTPLELFLWRALGDSEPLVAEYAARALADTPDVVQKMAEHSLEGFRIEIIGRLWPYLGKEKRLQILQATFGHTAVRNAPHPIGRGINDVTVIIGEMTPVIPGKAPQLTFSRDPNVQLGALMMLGDISLRDFKIPFARIVAANHDVLTAVALQAANGRGESLPVELLFKLLTANDEQVRTYTAQNLGLSANVSDISRIEALISQRQSARGKTTPETPNRAQSNLEEELRLSIKKIRFREQLASASRIAGQSQQEFIKHGVADPKLADFIWRYSCELAPGICEGDAKTTSPGQKLVVKPNAENLFPQRVEHYASIPNPGQTIQRFYETLQGIQMDSARSQANLALVLGGLRQLLGRQLAAPNETTALITQTGVNPDSPISWAGWIAEGAPVGTSSARRKALIVRVSDRERFERLVEVYQRSLGSFADLPDYLSIVSRLLPALPAILPLSAKSMLSVEPVKPKPMPLLRYSVVGGTDWNGFRIKVIEQRRVNSNGKIESDSTYLTYLDDVAILAPDLASIRELLGAAGSTRPNLESNVDFRRVIDDGGDVVYFSDLQSLSASLANKSATPGGRISESGALRIAKSSWENSHRLNFEESDWSKPLLPFQPRELSAPRELLPSSTIAYYFMMVDSTSAWSKLATLSQSPDHISSATTLWGLDFEKKVLPELGPECGIVMLDLPGFEASLASPTWTAFCKLKSNRLPDALKSGELFRGIRPATGPVELKFGSETFYVNTKSGFLIVSNRPKGLSALDHQDKLASARDYSKAAEAVTSRVVAFGGYNRAAAVAAVGDGSSDGLRGQQAAVIFSLAAAFHSQNFSATATAGSVEAESSVSMDREGRFAVSELASRPTNSQITYSTVEPRGIPIGDQKRLSNLVLKVRAKSSGALERIKEDIQLPSQTIEQKSPDELLVKVEPRRTKSPDKVLLPVGDPDLSPFLQSSVEIRSADERVIKQAREIIGNDRDAWSVARKLSNWTYKNLKWKYVASADAGQTLATLEADCSEFSQLYVAMARSVGLPARIVSGLAYGGNSFGGHAWVEVWVGKWIELDPTWGTDFVDATHIRNASGALLTYSALNLIELEVVETSRTVADFQLSPRALAEELTKTIPAGDSSALETALDLGEVVDELAGQKTWAGMSYGERDQMSSAYRRVLAEVMSGYGKNKDEARVMRLLRVEEKGEHAEATVLLAPEDILLKFRLLRRGGSWYLAEILQADTDLSIISETLGPAIRMIDDRRAGRKPSTVASSDFVRVLLLLDKDAQKSVDAADRALKIDPSHRGLRFLKALGLFGVEKQGDAVQLLNQLGNQQFPPALFRLAGFYKASETEAEKEQVINLYNRYLVLEPFDSRAHLAVAASYDKADNTAQAEASYRKAIEVDPQNTAGYEALTEFLVHRSRFGEVGAVLAAGDKVKVASQDLFGSVMQTLYYQEDGDSAEGFAASQPARMTTSINGNMYLARVHFDNDRALKALPLLKRAARIDKDSAEPHIVIAEVYRTLSRPTAALAAAEQGIRLEPESGAAHYQRACALARLGRTSAAMTALNRSIAINPFRAASIEEEKDLKVLAQLPAFKKLVAGAEQK
jgi:tetratricopeptide (TPR) repeat protein